MTDTVDDTDAAESPSLETMQADLELIGQHLRDALIRVKNSEATALGLFTALLSLTRGLSALKAPQTGESAYILTAAQRRGLSALIAHAEKCLTVADPTGQITGYIDSQRMKRMAAKASPGKLLLPGGGG